MATGLMTSITDDTIVVIQRGKVIGVLSPDAQKQVKTIKLIFSRETPEDQQSAFSPVQGAAVEYYPDTKRDPDGPDSL
jgi:hypothetical protein